MQFSFIDDRLTLSQVDKAKRNFLQLTVELGTRKDNYHVGSGFGGNNLQLLTLMSLDHSLVTSDYNITVKEDSMLWNVSMLTSNMKDIRKRFDKSFIDIPERYKYIASVLDNSNAYITAIINYKEQFPNLIKAIEGKAYKFDKSLSYIEKYIFVCIMCQELSVKLDNKDTSLVQIIGEALYMYPTEIILLSIRKFIGIERLIEHNLDEDKIFAKTLHKVQRAIHSE
jgi:hypothetical protein